MDTFLDDLKRKQQSFSPVGDLGNQLCTLASQIGIDPSQDDRIRREMHHLRGLMEALTQTRPFNGPVKVM